MKYIYAGYSKCGTKTMAKAFKDLGFVVYDYEEMFMYTIDGKNGWQAFENAKTKTEKYKILYNMLKDVDVVMDMPFHRK